MVFKYLNIHEKYDCYLGLFLFIFIFISPFVSYPFTFEPIRIGGELYIITVVFLFFIVKTIIMLGKRELYVYRLDFFLIVFISYNILNFYFLSNYTFNYTNLWLFVSYGFLFILLRAINNNYILTHKTQLILFFVFGFIQSIIACLQFFEVIDLKNEYYKVLGTFVNPNFLGIYMVIGCISGISFIMLNHQENKKINNAYYCFFIPLVFILLISESRASWVSLIMGLLVLLVTSKKNIKYIKALSKGKVVILIIGFILISITSLYLLYKISPDSVEGRKLIQKVSLSQIMDKPIFGHGLFTFTGKYNEAKSEYFLSNVRSWEEIKVANHFSNALNDYVHLFFEIGAIGFLILILLISQVFYKLKLNFKIRVALSFLVVFFTLAFFTSIIYNPSAFLILIWTINILLVENRNSKIVNIKLNRSLKGVFVLILFLSFFGLIFTLKKTKALSDYKKLVIAKRQINRPLPLKKILELSKFISDDPYMDFTIGEELYINDRKKEGLVYMERATSKNNSPLLNNVLAKVYESRKEFRKTESVLRKNTGIEPFKFKPKIDLMDFYGRIGEFEKQKMIAQDIVDLPVKIPSKLVDEYKEKAGMVLEYNKNHH